MQKARIQTGLIGRRCRIVTDEDAKEAAREQEALKPGSVQQDVEITVENWWPAFAEQKGREGTVENVFLDSDGNPAYTVNFSGKLEEVSVLALRFDEPHDAGKLKDLLRYMMEEYVYDAQEKEWPDDARVEDAREILELDLPERG